MIPMILSALLLLGLAQAKDDPPDPFEGLPGLGAPVVADLPPVEGECARAFDLVLGEPIPADLVTVLPDGSVVASCTATVVPTSQGLTTLAQADAYLQLLEERPLVERAWRRELGYWHQTTLDLRRPPPIWARPASQRWIGRAEAFGVVALAALLVRGLQPVLVPRE